MIEIPAVLSRCRLFDKLTQEQLSKLDALCRRETYHVGDVIFTEGEPSRDFYVVEEGKIALDANFSLRAGAWKRGTIDVLSEGQDFGWSAVTAMPTRTVTARAVEESTVLAMDGGKIMALLDADPRMGYSIMSALLATVFSRSMSTRRSLARILSIASHDLKAPLDAVQSYLRVLLGGYFGELGKRPYDVIERCSDRLSEFLQIIDNILDITGIEEGGLQTEWLSPVKLTTDVVDLLRQLAEKQGVTVDLETPAQDVEMRVAPVRLRQLVTNIVGNAIKFTPPGGKVYVRLADLGTELRLDVGDTGVGIPKEELSHIFDDFYRGDPVRIMNSLGREAKGTGLGLSIARKIVESHGGRIWAESPDPDTAVGSRFTVLLPKGEPAPVERETMEKTPGKGDDRA